MNLIQVNIIISLNLEKLAVKLGHGVWTEISKASYTEQTCYDIYEAIVFRMYLKKISDDLGNSKKRSNSEE